MKLGNARFMLLVGALTSGVLAFTSCKRPTPEVTSAPEPLPAATPIAVATPAPFTPIAVATPSPDPLAPPGIFFLIQKASITTDEGIIGLKPGQGVRQVSPGHYEVHGQTIELRDDQVTNNLRIARQFATADAATQAAWQKALRTPHSAATTGPANSSAAASTSTPPPITRTFTPQSTALTSGSRLGAGTGTADPETANRKNTRVDTSGRQYWRDSRGNIRYDY